MDKVLVINSEGFASSNTVIGNFGSMSISISDFEMATGWNLKPQGLCRGEMCVSVLKPENLANDGAINLVEFVRLTDQNYIHDVNHGVFAFGENAFNRSLQMTSLDAPDFTLPDIHGKQVSFSDFNRRKRLLLAWSSW